MSRNAIQPGSGFDLIRVVTVNVRVRINYSIRSLILLPQNTYTLCAKPYIILLLFLRIDMIFFLPLYYYYYSVSTQLDINPTRIGI